MLPELIADPTLLVGIEEGRLFGAEWIRAIGAIPNEYLYYYYFTRDAVAAIRGAAETRGEFLLHQQAAFYDDGGRATRPARWRSGGGSGASATPRTWPRAASRRRASATTPTSRAAATRGWRWRLMAAIRRRPADA